MSNSYYEQAVKFLTLEKLINNDGTYKLIFHNECFLIYTGKKYERIADNRRIERMIILASRKQRDLLENTSSFIIGNLIKNLESICFVEGIQDAQMINEVKPSNIHYIPMKNGILKLSITSKGITRTLIPHTHQFFCTYVLPYDYIPNANAPTFQAYSEEVLPIGELKLIQQFVGGCFLPQKKHEHILFLFGSGANGKSVLCVIIRLLIGIENVSPTSLDDLFERFSLIEIVDKLVNIVEEVSGDRYCDVAKLKDFSNGGMFYAEKKFGRKFPFTVITELIFATNIIPKIKDPSNAMKRRMLIVEFKKQFLDPKKQNRKLKDYNFWIESGELSGIFNWALQGLEELALQDWKLSIPQSVLNAAESHDRQSNPIKYFLNDYVEASPLGEIFCTDLLEDYRAFCKHNGFYAEDGGVFTKTLKIQFPNITQTEHQIRRKNKPRSRKLFGIRYKKLDQTQEVLNNYNITPPSFFQVSQVALLTQQLSANILKTSSPKKKCSLLTINEREVSNEK